MKEEQTAFLMVGGPVDGEIHAIPSTSRSWVIPVLSLEDRKYGLDEVPKAIPYSEYQYTKYCIMGRSGWEDIYIFVSSDLLREPHHHRNIMIKILSHYRVIK